MGRLSVWFDEDGSFNVLGNGVFERVDGDGNTIGFAILNAANRSDPELPFEAEFRRISST